MIDTVLPPLSAAAAIALTYVFCVRPMRRGRGCPTAPRQSGENRSQDCCRATHDGRKPAPPPAAAGADGTEAETARLREEVRLIRRHPDLRSREDAVQLRKDESR
ncbi:hypothetical protein [Streptomyces sp. YIM 98790]|uniref:hypothetical protein n=1 Tax=Streptomyces sp. YIM 98790 TaxID=2689077 RepID=UPI0014074DF7|nr:hypothetical protein [Streptomyces sp. YIM 98790]